MGSRLGSAAGAARTLDEFFRLCDAAGPDCAYSGNARGRYAELGEQLRADPLEIIDPFTGERFTFTYNDLIASTLGALYASFVWPDLAFFLADLEQQLSPSALGQRLAAVRTGLGLGTAAQEPYPNFVENFPGVVCSDSVNPRSFATWQTSADRAEARYGRFGRIWHWTASVCRAWPTSAGQDRHLGPWTARTAAPVLVVGNTFDPATPYSGAQAAARLLPNSRLLTYAGWGHTAFLGINFCVDNYVTRYLVSGQVPPAGATCRPEGSPFGPTEATTQATAAAAALYAEVVPPAVRRALRAN